MKSKIPMLIGLSVPIMLGLAGCSNNSNQVHTTPENVMQLVKTGVGEIKSSNTTAGKNNPAIYNANTANIATVEKEDMVKVEFMPSGYLPIGSPTSGGSIGMGGTVTNTGLKNQSQNANTGTIEKNIKNNENTKPSNNNNDNTNSKYGFSGQPSNYKDVSPYQTITKGSDSSETNKDTTSSSKSNKVEKNYGLNGAEQAEKEK